MVLFVLFFSMIAFVCLIFAGAGLAIRNIGTGVGFLGCGLVALVIVVNVAVSESARVKELQAADDGILYVTGQSETFTLLKKDAAGHEVRMFRLQELKTDDARQAAMATTAEPKGYDAIVGSDISSPISKVFAGEP